MRVDSSIEDYIDLNCKLTDIKFCKFVAHARRIFSRESIQTQRDQIGFDLELTRSMFNNLHSGRSVLVGGSLFSIRCKISPSMATSPRREHDTTIMVIAHKDS